MSQQAISSEIQELTHEWVSLYKKRNVSVKESIRRRALFEMLTRMVKTFEEAMYVCDEYRKRSTTGEPLERFIVRAASFAETKDDFVRLLAMTTYLQRKARALIISKIVERDFTVDELKCLIKLLTPTLEF